jgi:transcriptional regulator with XRE-family HTH domain
MELGELVARNIRMLRHAGDLSQEDLADRVGCSVRYIGLLEKGAHSPTVNMLADIARALNVQPFVLLLDAAPRMIADPGAGAPVIRRRPRTDRAPARKKS